MNDDLFSLPEPVTPPPAPPKPWEEMTAIEHFYYARRFAAHYSTETTHG